MRSVLPAFVAWLMITALLVVGCSDAKPTDGVAPDPTPITVDTVRRITKDRIIPVSGQVVSPGSPTLAAFLVSGKVLEAIPREGDWVEQGQRLAAIDPTDYHLASNAAAAQAAEARIALDQAADEYKRMHFLLERKSLAPNDFEKFKTARALAGARLDQARANAAIMQKRLADTTLDAPVAGFIIRRLVEPGQMVAAGVPAFEIIRLDPVEIQVGVPETDIDLVQVGQPARVGVPALGGAVFSGTVQVVNVGADMGTRTYMTRIRVPNPDHRLKLGMVAKAEIQIAQKIETMTLPVAAIVTDHQGATLVFVYYPEQQHVYSTRVTIGSVIGQAVEITAGLSGDERVVVAGQDRLRDGAAVTLVRPEANKKKPGGASHESN